jgi:hypothetical protein
MNSPATTTTVIFTCGVLGSLGIELTSLLQVFHTEPIKMPERYKRPLYWLCRLLLALGAGGLAVAYEVQKPLLAVNIGASAPLILQALASGIQGLHGRAANGEDVPKVQAAAEISGQMAPLVPARPPE